MRTFTPLLLLLSLLLHHHHASAATPSLYRPILFDPTPGRPPSRIVLSFPSKWMSGGPAHMHAIVAALNHAGFHGAMYHVNERYSRDYADGFCCDESGKPFDTDDPTIPLFRNLTALRPGDLTSRDLLIVPPLLHQHSHNNEWSHAEELAIRKSGVRTIVIVTGISPPETPTALSHLDLTEGSRIPLAHSHYTHNFYNLPWDPETSLIWAPLEPRWLKAHHEFVKEGGAKATRSTPTHVLMDPDATNFGFTYPCPKHMKHTVLHNLTFVEVREYYEKATLLVDLSLNGHEHCPREVRSFFFFFSFFFFPSSSSFLLLLLLFLFSSSSSFLISFLLSLYLPQNRPSYSIAGPSFHERKMVVTKWTFRSQWSSKLIRLTPTSC